MNLDVDITDATKLKLNMLGMLRETKRPTTYAKIEKILFHLGIITISVVSVLGIQQSHIILIVQEEGSVA